MTIHKIDNSAKDIGKVVLWQYDNAHNLLSLLAYFKDMFDACIKSFWDAWPQTVLAIDGCGAFGLSAWGLIIGIKRPTVHDDGNTRTIDDETYRRLLKATFFRLRSYSSMEDIGTYLKFLFGTENGIGVEVIDHKDMSAEFVKTVHFDGMYKDLRLLYEQHYEDVIHYPAGIRENVSPCDIVFGFHGQENDKYAPLTEYKAGDIVYHLDDESGEIYNYRCLSDMSATTNTGWETVKTMFAKTYDGDPCISSFSLVRFSTNDVPFVEELEFPISNLPNVFYWKSALYEATRDLGSPLYIYDNSGLNRLEIEGDIRQVSTDEIDRWNNIRKYQENIAYPGNSIFSRNGELYAIPDGYFIYASLNSSFSRMSTYCQKISFEKEVNPQSSSPFYYGAKFISKSRQLKSSQYTGLKEREII